jgi:hypothetical protein
MCKGCTEDAGLECGKIIFWIKSPVERSVLIQSGLNRQGAPAISTSPSTAALPSLANSSAGRLCYLGMVYTTRKNTHQHINMMGEGLLLPLPHIGHIGHIGASCDYSPESSTAERLTAAQCTARGRQCWCCGRGPLAASSGNSLNIA